MLRIAFASCTGESVDAHFGQAERFYLWDIDATSAKAVGLLEIEADGEEREDKITMRASALKECALVYTTQIGGPAAAKLVSRHIHPVKSPPDTKVSDAIAKLQTVLQGKPPPWLRKALDGRQPQEVEGCEK